MNSISAMNLGIQGINKGMEGLKRNARDVASLGTNKDAAKPGEIADANSLTNTMVDMKSNKLQVEMSAKVVETASDMIGTIIDVTA